jgi:hypothetical protein
MRRLLAALATVAALASPAYAGHYPRECGGVLDVECSGRVCPFGTDCWTRDCLVWVDPLHDDTLAQCVRPLV